MPSSALAIGSISGTVTEEAAGHAPIEDVRVCAFEEEGFEREAELGVNCELTDDNGDYTISALPAGKYVVDFWPGFEGLNYSYEYYDDEASWFEADLVQVTTTPKTGIDAELAAGGEIEGEVVNASGGAPIEEVFVCAELSESPWYVECVQTDGAGNYRLAGLPAGEYWLEFWPGETNFVAQFEGGVPVSVGGVTHRNAALQAGATINGRVTDATTHLGLAGIFVCASDVGEGEFGGCQETGSGGSYSIGRLPAATYKVAFAPFAEEEEGLERDYLTQYFNGKSTWLAADPIALSAGGTRSGVDAALARKHAAVVTPPPPPVTLAPVLTTAAPSSKALNCKKGFHKKTIKGRQHCIRIHKKHRKAGRGHGRALHLAARAR